MHTLNRYQLVGQRPPTGLGTPMPPLLRLLLELLGLGLLGWQIAAAATLPNPLSNEQRLQQALDLAQAGEIATAMRIIGPLDTSPTTPSVGRLAFLRATLAQRLQDSETAQHAYTRVWLTYPPLADHAAWELAQVADQQDNLAVLTAIVKTLQADYANSLHAPASQLLLAQAQYRLNHFDAARLTIEQFLQSYPSHHKIPNARYLQAQLAETMHETATAAQLLRRLGESYPQHPLAVIALRRSRELWRQLPAASRPEIDFSHALTDLDHLLQARHWEEAELRLRALRAQSASVLSASRALLTQATIAQGKRQWRSAITLLHQLLLRHPKSPERAEAHYRLAQLYRRQGHPDSSETHYRHAMAHRNDLVWAPKALLTLARTREDQDDLAEASSLYHQFVETYPNHDDVINSFWRSAWLQYRLGRYDLAASMWRLFIRRYPHNPWSPQVLYWLGRVAHQQNQLANAKALYQRVATDYPFHYYSLRAREQLRHLSISLQPLTLPDTPNVTWDSDPVVALPKSSDTATALTPAQFHLIRVQEFQHLQMHRRARYEINAIAKSLPETHAAKYFLAQLYAASHYHIDVFRNLNQIVSQLQPSQVNALPRKFWTLLYPKVFWDDVSRHAQPNDLPPYLILSLMRQESAFNPRAMSGSKARGLMQLIPSTARTMARQLRLRHFNLRMLFEPGANIRLGTHYLATQLQHFDHNPVFAMAAYNAGPRRAKTWRKRWPDLPLDEFIETIPFDETRLYVKLILRNLLIYDYLYNPVPDA